MKIKKIILITFIFIITIALINTGYNNFFKKPEKELFQTENPEKRNIYQIIYATGKLEIKGNIKVGSLVAGTIKNILVKENDKVTKGQLLADIDNGKGDTDVKKAEGELEKAEAELEYQKKYYSRQKDLYESNQISKDSFEQTERDLKKNQADVFTKKADLEQKSIEFNNTKILAPTSGIITSVGITKGQKITTDLDATILFEIADDITKMEADLDIDESDIGQVRKNQKVKFVVGAHLYKIFKGIITDLSYSPKVKNGILSYKATVDIDNKNLLLRPGMSINAKINTAKSINCLSISSQSFQINEQTIKHIAQKLNFKFIPISEKRKKELEKIDTKNYSLKYVWTLKDESFIEKEIKIGITDDNYFEIKSGLTENDKVIIDVEEPDEMSNLYKKMFKSAF